MAKVRASEKGPGAPPLLDKLREEIEGISSTQTLVIRRASALTRVRGIRNAHAAKLGSIFFIKNKFGKIIFFPLGGKKLLHALFFASVQAYVPQDARV